MLLAGVENENDLWNMLSREDHQVNGREWSIRMAPKPGRNATKSKSRGACLGIVWRTTERYFGYPALSVPLAIGWLRDRGL